MMYNLLVSLGIFTLNGFNPTITQDSTELYKESFEIVDDYSNPKTVKWQDVETLLTTPSDITYVINFWATFCKPCIAELPHFDQLKTANSSKKIKIILLSLDFIKDFDTKVPTFLNQNRVQNEVWLYGETNPNQLINAVNPNWSGEIPGTLFININAQQRKFINKEMSYYELQNELNSFLNSIGQ